MGRITEITLQQDLVNKINAKQGFSHALVANTKRYVVGYKTVLKASNPSIEPGVHSIVERALNNAPDGSEVFGGWMAEDGTYYVDYSTTHDGLTVALDLAFLRGELAIWDTLDSKEIKVCR